MLLGDFIKELKHNSLQIMLSDYDEICGNYIFNGTLGEMKNNIHYQSEWCKWKIKETLFYYDENMKNVFHLIIKELK